MAKQKDPVQKLLTIIAQDRNEYFRIRRKLPPIGDPARVKVDAHVQKALNSLQELLFGTE